MLPGHLAPMLDWCVWIGVCVLVCVDWCVWIGVCGWPPVALLGFPTPARGEGVRMCAPALLGPPRVPVLFGAACAVDEPGAEFQAGCGDPLVFPHPQGEEATPAASSATACTCCWGTRAMKTRCVQGGWGGRKQCKLWQLPRWELLGCWADGPASTGRVAAQPRRRPVVYGGGAVDGA